MAPLLPLLPVLAAGLAWLGLLGTGALVFGSMASAASALFWMGTYRYARLNPLWGLLYPVAAFVLSFIFAEAAWRGSKVAWKGRDYISERAQ